jgi:hypothetical protein
MVNFNNGFRIQLGPLTGLDNDFNQAVSKIDPNLPKWQQDIAVYNAAALDMSNSTLSYSSFYDPKRLHKVMGKVVDNMGSSFAPGLMEQIFPSKLFNPATNSSFDFLSVPMDTFYNILNNPTYGQDVKVPVQLEQNPNTGVAFPSLPTVGAEALHFAAIGNLAPFYTPANPFQPYSSLFYGAGQPTLAQFPLNPGLPNRGGFIVTQPYNERLREQNFFKGFGVFPPVRQNPFPFPPLPLKYQTSRNKG